MMPSASKSLRLHIALLGRRNAGKSSLLNALTRQAVSIVSSEPGTTTDPVEKAMELQPLGPVLFVDTAGLDDTGALGRQRVERSLQVLDRADVAIVAAEPAGWGELEDALLAELQRRATPAVVAFTKADRERPAGELVARLRAGGRRVVETSAETGEGLGALREALVEIAPEHFVDPPAIASDLVSAGETAVLVVPIDKEAPRGRLILPQVQAIRDLLDGDALCLVTKERELRRALDSLRTPPRLVVTDSQAFLKVAADVPQGVPLTSFSILFARAKGDLASLVEGAMAIDALRPGDRVLVSEACTHHPIGEDIGRVKIPRWLTQYAGGALAFEHVQGRDFPEDLRRYRLVVHCGACTFNRRAMLTRLARAREQGVPVTNYGLAIAWSLGIFERALSPFPAALDAYRRGGAAARAAREAVA